MVLKMNNLQNKLILQIMEKLDNIEQEITTLKIKIDKMTSLFNFLKPIIVLFIIYIIYKSFGINLHNIR